MHCSDHPGPQGYFRPIRSVTSACIERRCFDVDFSRGGDWTKAHRGVVSSPALLAEICGSGILSVRNSVTVYGSPNCTCR
jgi:hypothetical protein